MNKLIALPFLVLAVFKLHAGCFGENIAKKHSVQLPSGLKLMLSNNNRDPKYLFSVSYIHKVLDAAPQSKYQVLDLSATKLTTIPSVLEKFEELKELDLSANDLRDASMALKMMFKHLEWLNLSGNSRLQLTNDDIFQIEERCAVEHIGQLLDCTGRPKLLYFFSGCGLTQDQAEKCAELNQQYKDLVRIEF